MMRWIRNNMPFLHYNILRFRLIRASLLIVTTVKDAPDKRELLAIFDALEAYTDKYFPRRTYEEQTSARNHTRSD